MIALIGYRGTGKTTIARILADSIGCPWGDTDAAVEVQAGRTIAEIFQSEGEPVFRDMESRVLHALMKAHAHEAFVLATGGGIILRKENRDALASARKVVWLKANPKTLLQRIENDQKSHDQRPNLTSLGRLAEIDSVLAQREPLYRASAQWEIDTTDRSPEEIAAEILAESRPPVA